MVACSATTAEPVWEPVPPQAVPVCEPVPPQAVPVCEPVPPQAVPAVGASSATTAEGKE